MIEYNDPLSRLSALLSFVREFSGLVEPHAFCLARPSGVAHLQRTWPTDWLDFVDSLEGPVAMKDFQDSCIAVLLENQSPPDSWPQSLCDFIVRCQSLALRRELLSEGLPGMPIKSPDSASTDLPKVPLPKRKMKMSLKKEHEVARLSEFIIEFGRTHGIDAIVDVGSGSGYLSHRLSQEFPILAIDGDASRIHYSQGSQQVPSLTGTHRFPIEHVTLHLDTKALSSLLDSYSLDANGHLSKTRGRRPKYLLTALHACGDLSASTILESYKSGPAIKCIVVIGCCYQMMTPKGFPLSEQVKVQSVVGVDRFPYEIPRRVKDDDLPLLQTSYRLLNSACQTMVNFSPQRIRDTWQSFLYRALLEAFLESKGQFEYSPDEDFAQSKLKVGMTGKDVYSNGFLHYAQVTLKRLGHSTIEDSEILDFQSRHDMNKLFNRMALTSTIKRLLGPCIESLLLLDRLAYLKEGNMRSSLMNIFDYATSPRNVMLVSVMDSKDQCQDGSFLDIPSK